MTLGNAPKVTDEQVLAALDPNGATMKLGAIAVQVGQQIGFSESAVYRDVEAVLRRLRKAGTVELVKGYRAGYRRAIRLRKVTP